MSRYRLLAVACVVLIAAGLLPLEGDAASLAEVKERGWLRVCAHPAALPFSSQDRVQPGFQLEIADAIAKVLGVKVIPDWIVFTRHARRASCDAIIGAVVPLVSDKTPRREAGLSELQEQLNAAMQKLSPPHRLVVTLHDVQGLPHEEIANIMDCNIGTVRSRLFYARQQLQAYLSDYLK